MASGLAVMSGEDVPDGISWLQMLIQHVDWHAVLNDINAATDSVNAIKASVDSWLMSAITDTVDFAYTLTVSDILYGIAAVLIVAAYIQRHSNPRIDYRNERRRRDF